MPNFIVFEGKLGAGKTLGAVLYANHLKARAPSSVMYSNFDMKGAKPISDLDTFLEIAMNPSSIVVLDEAHVDLDARSFSTNHVKFLTAITFYLRKIRCTLILTSPMFDNLDSRIRNITNAVCYVSSDKNYFYYPFYDPVSSQYLGIKKARKERVFKANLYDTNSIVSQLQVPAKREDFDRYLDELKQVSLDYYFKQKQAQ